MEVGRVTRALKNLSIFIGSLSEGPGGASIGRADVDGKAKRKRNASAHIIRSEASKQRQGEAKERVYLLPSYFSLMLHARTPLSLFSEALRAEFPFSRARCRSNRHVHSLCAARFLT